jgi:dolichyl-phosphate beta-glucosyltransferase
MISIVIPAYNEAKRLAPTLISIRDYISKQEGEFEVILVDDGSQDETVRVAKKFVQSMPLRIEKLPVNQGKGTAVRHGMLASRGEQVLFMDADNSTDISHLDEFLRYLGEYDVVIASRDLPESQVEKHQNWTKELSGRIGNILIQSMALRGIKDTQCGFKLFSRKAVDIVFPKVSIQRWGFDIEALVIADFHGLKIKEHPVRWVNDERSNVKWSDYPSVMLELFLVQWRKFRGKYR